LPQKQPIAGGVGQMAFTVHGGAHPHQHRLDEQIVLVDDFARTPFVGLLRRRHQVEVAHNVTRRPEQVAVDGGRREFVQRFGRQARLDRGKLGRKRFDLAGQALRMAARGGGKAVTGFGAPGGAGGLGKTGGVAQVAGEDDEVAAQCVDVMTERVDAIERKHHGGGSQRKDQQSRDIADPDRTDEGRIFRHAQPQHIRIILMVGITLDLH